MLHVKTDYLLTKKEFIFEANTNVAANYKDNDAKLLRDWVVNQFNPSEELLKECSEKVKSIVSKYIPIQIKLYYSCGIKEKTLTLTPSLTQKPRPSSPAHPLSLNCF